MTPLEAMALLHSCSAANASIANRIFPTGTNCIFADRDLNPRSRKANVVTPLG